MKFQAKGSSKHNQPCPIPKILNATDAIVRINASAICGSDLHNYRAAPYLYGHEGIGHVVEVGDAVQYLNVGD
jgi:threonine dehydrogenase-like Zn-dependent dehydrogenase